MEGQAPQNGTTTAMPQLPPPPGRSAAHHDTYIVQFPKDQIYRVPPSENAKIVEKYRNPAKAKRGRRFCCCCCCHRCPRLLLTIILILVAIIAVVGITLAVLFIIFHPKGPSFSITHVVVKNPAGPRNSKNSPPQYEISLKAKNPNQRLGIVYEDSEVSLLFEDTKVATGKFPRLEQGKDDSTQVKVELTGINGALPKKMVKSMDDDKSNRAVDLDLDMRLWVKIKAVEIKTWDMKSNVACMFKVSKLGNDTRILSQECDAKFKQY